MHKLQDRPIWTPRPGMQSNVFRSSAKVIGLGGQAGGGKSDTMFGLAWYRHPRSIVFRKELTQMNNRIISRGNEIFVDTGVGEYRGQPHRQWTHARGFLRMGALAHSGDFSTYRGGEWSGMFFDEATDMLRENVQMALGWNRSTQGAYCQAFMYFNPPQDVAGEWVIEYFGPWIDDEYSDPHNLGKAEEGEIRYFMTVEGVSSEVKDGNPVEIKGPDGISRWITPESRTFYWSKLDENPDLGDDYVDRLASLPYPLNEQLLYGDFNVGREPGAFQVIPSTWLVAANRRWEAHDAPSDKPKQIGIDIARGGKAQTVLARYRNGYFWDLVKRKGSFTPDGESVCNLIKKYREPGVRLQVDEVGVGTAVHDLLKRDGIPFRGINGSEPTDALNKTRQLGFANVRSEMWWKLREALNPASNMELAIPKDEQLKIELCTPRFRLVGGRMEGSIE